MLLLPAGFKSRALRVGGTAELSAAAMASAAATTAAADEHVPANRSAAAQPTSSRLMGPPAAVGAEDTHTATARATEVAQPGAAPAAACADEDAAAACRKRRAGHGSTPSPKTSPKLAAAYKDGQQCKVQPHEGAAQAAAAPGVHRPEGAAAVVTVDAGSSLASGDSSSSDDSVPLVSSKLAARLPQDRGTPRAGGKHKDEAGEGLACIQAVDAYVLACLGVVELLTSAVNARRATKSMVCHSCICMLSV